MARGTIKQRIALDGGAEIRKELLELGRAGEVVWAKLNKLSKQEIVPTSFQTRLAAIKGAYDSVAAAGAKFGAGLKPIQKNAEDLAASVGNIRDRIALVGVALTGAVAGLVAFAKAAGDSGGAINDAAQKTGLSIEKYQTLSASAKQAGVDIGSFDSAFAKLNKSIADARNGGFMTKTSEDIDGVTVSVTKFKSASSGTTQEAKDLQKVFKDLGVSLSDLRNLSNADILAKLQDAFKKMPDGPEKVLAETKLFGKAGSELTSFMNQGAKATKEFEDRMKSLGLVLSDDAVKSLDTLGDTTDDLGKAFGVLRDKIVASFADDLTSGANGLLKFLADNQQAIVDFVHYIGSEAAGIIKDFYNAFTGQGLDVNRPWVLEWTKRIQDFGTAVKTTVENVVIPAFNGLAALFQTVADSLNAVFGTNLNATDIVVGIGLMVVALKTVSPAVMLVVNSFRLLFTLFTANPWGLVIAGLVLLAVAIYQNWDKIVATVSAKWDLLKAYLAQGWVNVQNAAAAAVDAIKGFFSGLADYLSTSWEAIKAGARNAWQAVQDGASQAWTAIKGFFTAEGFAAFWAGLTKGASDAWEAIKKGFTDLGTAVKQAFTDALASIKSAWTDFTGTIANAVTTLIGGLKDLISWFEQAGAAADANLNSGDASSSGTGAGFGSGFASGGHVRGRGTSTSDSIPAYLSDYEFVVQARAVRKYGLSFLNALNAGRLKLPGYSTGGLVKSVQQFKFGLPAFSGGGLATLGNPMRNLVQHSAMGGGMVPANIHIPGHAPVPVMASSSALQQLARAAGHKKLTTGGTKPSWYK